MHLLNAIPGGAAAADGAVDLKQSPGDIVILSAADTELSALSSACAGLPEDFPSLRLANLLQLGHPYAVDLYAESVIAHARLVIVRLLGGQSYWSYGVERLSDLCRARGILLAFLPGDRQPDPGLDGFSTVDDENRAALFEYFREGGIENLRHALHRAAALIGRDEDPPAARPLPAAGLYWPQIGDPDLDSLRQAWDGTHRRGPQPVAAIVFYRALMQAGDLAAVDALIAALASEGLNPLPIYVTSLKDRLSADIVGTLLDQALPDVILNATSFALGSPAGNDGGSEDPLGQCDCPVLQVVFATQPAEDWRTGTRGLNPRDLAIAVALPEIDGRILSRAVAFKAEAQFDTRTECSIVRLQPDHGRCAFVAKLACAWSRLGRLAPAERKVALVMANYPNRDGRIGNGVGLDTPQSAVEILRAMKDAGYELNALPVSGNRLIEALIEGVTNDFASAAGRRIRVVYPLALYRRFFERLPPAIQQAVTARWGEPEDDPHIDAGADGRNGFALPVLPLGNVAVMIQPARGYNIDPARSYHDPDLVPPHHYFAAYAWLRESFGADAVIHCGKHGNLEWLPGKALALSEDCLPEAVFGPMPQLYPFIVNDPGEGTQAKRRTAAVILDHLTPPLTRAEIYGDLAALEQLVDEYYEAAGMDRRRLPLLAERIIAETRRLGLDADCDIQIGEATDTALLKLDNHLCDLKELQIRDGLHVYGTKPHGEQLIDLLVALVRLPRGDGKEGRASILRALSSDLGLGFDPLGTDYAAPWDGPQPAVLADLAPGSWRSHGDTIERLEILAKQLVADRRLPDESWLATRAVLQEIDYRLRAAVLGCGRAEIENLLRGLDGRFVPPGPSGAPTRGRPEVLPTGRNFFSLDARSLPTPTAWTLGWQSADALLQRHRQDHGEWPRAILLNAWGTANMRTGGDDIAQALALIGARPTWETTSGRVTGFEIVPPDLLDRPRIDVTLKVSGFFRDAFPMQLNLFDAASRAVQALDEPPEVNPLAQRVKDEAAAMMARGLDAAEAKRRAGYRVFGAQPGAYGAGLQAMIDEGGWTETADLARAYIAWGGYAYGGDAEGIADAEVFVQRLSGIDTVVQNQDNREHDLLDSDDYYQFEGGAVAAVQFASGTAPTAYHNDHSRPEAPRIRRLEEEIARVVRGRAANPKWIAGVKRHGYKGAFEIAATVDYLFAFAATTGLVRDHQFEALYDAYLADAETRSFLESNNPAGAREIAERFAEAIRRGLWHPKTNSVPDLLERMLAA
ncbi:MAG: cobaltochelatase subunit CobN [Ferrovibrio sp.]|uniref:cobaltochelatase subunit CobN n=1 Tax=Ferrovibrio sp. TaxID=1917215 RepID=UPI00263224B5|nr:cobaltochelatase subunit CobN [Ferrovibrio sp.]MCW0233942.1 cobaltochelatase subunit CobN [Ferrovibrio sp.]